MTWYAAHAVLAVEFKDGQPGVVSAFENIYLISASDADEAIKKAEKIGTAQQGDAGGSFYWEDRPARFVFVGIRKLNSVANSQSAENEPSDGAEVTYQQMRFESASALKAFVAGEETTVTLTD